MITTEISSHVRYLLGEKGVRLLSLGLLWSEDGLFLSTSVANETINLNTCFELNQCAKTP